MSLLFAHIEHQIRRTAATVGRAIVETLTGFANFDASKYLLTETDPDDTKSCRAPEPLDCLGCDWYGNCELPTSAVPPTAADDPVADTSQPATGSPTAVPAGLRREGASPAGLAIPAICQVLAHHTPDDSRIGIWCGPDWADFETPDSADHLRHFADWQEWRAHVAPLIFAQFFKPQQ